MPNRSGEWGQGLLDLTHWHTARLLLSCSIRGALLILRSRNPLGGRYTNDAVLIWFRHQHPELSVDAVCGLENIVKFAKLTCKPTARI